MLTGVPPKFPAERATLTLFGAGFLPVTLPLKTLPFSADGLWEVEVTLRQGRAVAGLLLDRDGLPFPGGTVSCWDPQNYFPRGSEILVARSGDDGRFLLEGLPEGVDMVVWAHGEKAAMEAGPVRIPLAGVGNPLALKLDAVGEVRGRVVDARGKPLGGVCVDYSDFLGDVVPTFVSVSRYVETDADGRFRLKGIPSWCRGSVRANWHFESDPWGRQRCVGSEEVSGSADVSAEGLTIRIPDKVEDLPGYQPPKESAKP